MKKILYLFCILLFSCKANIENKDQSTDNNLIDIPGLQSKDSLNNNVVPLDETRKKKNRTFLKKTSDELNKDSSCLSKQQTNSTNLEEYLRKFGLVDVQEIESGIRVDLKYSTTDNFVGIDMYGDLEKAFCQPDVAQKLKQAYAFLQEEDSNLTLLVFDAVRPVFVQQKMWDTLVMPIHEKTKFLSNPKNHSIHNYGAAVDISIITKSGKELDMGTPFDFIGELAHPREEQKLIKAGKLTEKQMKNRVLLRKVMRKAGFFNIQTEWWHWNSCSRNTAKRNYKVVR